MSTTTYFLPTRDVSRLILPLWWLVVVCLFPGWLLAQYDPGQAIQFTDRDGLPSMNIYKVIQDEKGYIWLGTEAGLVRYDGYNFKVFTTRDGLPNNDIIRVRQDRAGKLWIASIGPLCYRDGEHFVQVDEKRVNSSVLGFDMQGLSNGDVWLSRGRQVFYYQPDKGYLPHNVGFEDDAFVVKRFLHQAKDTLWIYKNSSFYQVEKREVLQRHNPQLAPVNDSRFCMTMHGGKIYYISTQGLACFDVQTKEEKLVVRGMKKANQLLVYHDQVFMVNFEEGISVYDFLPNGDLELAYEMMKTQNPTSVIIDTEGNLWVTTFGNGLYFIARQIVEYEDLSALIPTGISRLSCVENLDGKLIVATDDGRVWWLDPEHSSAELIFKDTVDRGVIRVFEVAEDSFGNIYVAGEYGFFRCKDGECFTLSRLTIKQMKKDQADNFWFSTNYGVFRVASDQVKDATSPVLFMHKRSQGRNRASYLTYNRSYAIYPAANKEIWLDDMVNGLTQIKATGDTIFWASKSGIFYAQAKDMLHWKDSIVVVATQGEGIVLIKGDEYRQINSLSGLPSDICNALLVEDGKLWIATNKGLAVLSDINWEEKVFSIRTIDHNDGLITDHVEDMTVFGGRLALATSRGVLLLEKDLMPALNVEPKIYLHHVEINNQKVATDTSLRLTHRDNNLTFHFTALSYSSMGEIKYAYRMRGLDDSWSYSSSREVRFIDLAPGDYTFELFAINKFGQSPQPVRYDFTIAPAFYERPVFIMLALLLGLLLSVGIGYTLNAFRQRAVLRGLVDEKTHILNQKIEQLANANSRLEHSNEELEQFARVVSHDLKSPLRTVASFVQLLERRAKAKLDDEELEYIQLAVEGTRSMQSVINDLLKMSRVGVDATQRQIVELEELAQGIFKEHQVLVAEKNAQLIIDTPLPALYMSKVNAKQLLQNLIVNGLTYNEKEKAEIHLGCEELDGQWQIYVRDNGIGLSEEFQEKVFVLFQRLHTSKDYPGTGIGLAICKKIVERNGGRIWFESVAGEGTTFYFTMSVEKTRIPPEATEHADHLRQPLSDASSKG